MTEEDTQQTEEQLGFRLILGFDGTVTALPPKGQKKHNMTDEQIIEAVKHMVEGAEVSIVDNPDE